MVKTQIIRRGIKNKRVINAMLKVERHRFVPKELQKQAYEDYPLPIGEGQTISQPYMVAVMTEAIEPKHSDRVLEIGTGSGYQTAVLAEIVKEVYSIERIEILAKKAKKLLEELGYKNIFIRVSDGTLGWEEFSPFDSIIVTAGAKRLPQPLFNQLKEGGRIVIPLGGELVQTLTIVTKKNNLPEYKELFDCMFVPLIGEYG